MDEDIKENIETEESAHSNLEAVKEELGEQAQENEVNDFKSQLQALKKDYDEINNKFFRISADFQNYKKRAEKEKSDIYNYANEKLILELLPIADNLERAVKSAKDEGQGESILKGIEMIYQQFSDILKKNGVQEIFAVGEPFDHNYHHAVMQEEHPDYENNTVIGVFQKGYTLNEKVIRPSMVKVSN